MYGGLAGAYFGIDGIPERWRERLVQVEPIEKYADALFALSSELPGGIASSGARGVR